MNDGTNLVNPHSRTDSRQVLALEKKSKHGRRVSNGSFSNSGIPENSPKELNPREHQLVISPGILPSLAKPYESESLTSVVLATHVRSYD